MILNSINAEQDFEFIMIKSFLILNTIDATYLKKIL